jgi:Glyoxalase superfamily protein
VADMRRVRTPGPITGQGDAGAVRQKRERAKGRPIDEEVVPVLCVEDAARAVAWYPRLGFAKEWEHQFEPGFPLFVSVARGNVRIYLSEHEGDARPDTLIHLYVKDIDAVSEEFGIPVEEAGLAG